MQTLIPFQFLHPTFIGLATKFSTFENMKTYKEK
jgi:hypothetical protein